MQALVIDDSRATRAILRNVLKGAGFAVAEAENGREGLERLRQLARVDLVLVDWNMPEMDGIAFIRAARADPAYAAVSVLMVTLESEAPRVAAALEAGANAYVHKPFTAEKILEKVRGFGLPRTGAADLAAPLPARAPSQALAEPQAKATERRALVVDDARSVRMILRHVLRQIGFEVSEAGDGRAALEHLEKAGRPDVVFVDCFMPEMDGFEFIRAVRADARYAGLRLLMASGDEVPAEQARALKEGADAYITKPFSREMIQTKLEQLGLTAGTPR